MNLSPTFTIAIPLSASVAPRAWIASCFESGVSVFILMDGAGKLLGRRILAVDEFAVKIKDLIKLRLLEINRTRGKFLVELLLGFSR